MTLWIAWSVLTAALVAAGAMSLERVAAYLGKPRRITWLVSMTLAVCAPVAIAFRPGDAESASATAAAVRAGLRESPRISPSPPRLALDSTFSTADASPATHALRRAAVERTRAVITTADPWIMRAWIVASSILFLVLLRATVAVRRLRSRLEAVGTEIGDALVGRNVGPAVVGVVRPRVVIPSWVLSLDAERRSMLLRHEFEHVRAGDTRLLFAVEVALALFPWNAPLWWMARRLRLAIEIDCDARVIRAVGRARAYGDMLLSVADRYSAQLPNAASLSEPRLNLEARIEAMTTPRRQRPVLASLPFVAIALAVLLTAAWTPRPDGQLGVRRAVDPQPLPGNATPRYPQMLRDADMSGYVTARFSTDDRGVPMVATITVIESTHDSLAAAVRRAIPSWRFDSGGTARLVFRFLTTNMEEREAARGSPPAFVIDGVPLTPKQTVVITTASPIGSVQTADSTLRAVGYLQRRSQGSGFFVDGGMIDRNARVFSDVIRRAPGLRLTATGNGRTNVISDAQKTDGCVNVFVDGVFWQPVTPGDVDEQVRPEQLIAVEVYHDDATPPQYQPRGQGKCATIIAWTTRWAARGR